MPRRARWILALFLVACAGGEARAPAVLLVGTSGDYAPFSVRAPDGARDGFDVALVRAFARERGLRVRWVPFAWTTLERDFAAGRFDLVASGVTVRPERSLAGRFSVPTASAGAVALVRDAGALGRERFRIAVNRGGHLERVAERLFPRARLLPLAPNRAVRDALLAGEVDAAVTDTLEAPHWLAGTSGLTAVGPLTRDWKAWWLPAGAGERARDVDAWLLAREADGTLAALRARHLGAAAEPTAAPLAALAAAVAERLALMPLVAEAKRAAGTPVRVPAQEAAVLAAAPEAVRPLFAALVEAARDVQEHTLAGERAVGAPPDLDAALRPALARISERIAFLALRLPAGLSLAEARAALAPLDVPGLGAEPRERIAAALVEVKKR